MLTAATSGDGLGASTPWLGALRALGASADSGVSWEPTATALIWLADVRILPVYVLAVWGASVLARRRAGPAALVSHAPLRLLVASTLAVALVVTIKSGLGFKPPAWPGQVIAGGAARLDSFLSAHAAFAALLAATFWAHARPDVRMVLLAFVVCVGAAVVVLGRQYPVDVLAGWLLGWVCAATAAWIARVRTEDRIAGHCLLWATAVFAADLLSKLAATTTLAFAESLPVTDFFAIVHWQNRGAAFGLLSRASGWQAPVLIAIALAASVWLVRAIRAVHTPVAQRFALAAILAGALANAVDRLVRGAVVDWLDLHAGSHHWPAFNLADISITAGAVALLVTSIRAPHPAVQHAPTR